MKGIIVKSPVGLESQLYIADFVLTGDKRAICVSQSMRIDLDETLKKVEDSIRGYSKAYLRIKEVEVPPGLVEYLRKSADLEADRKKHERECRSLFFRTYPT